MGCFMSVNCFTTLAYKKTFSLRKYLVFFSKCLKNDRSYQRRKYSAILDFHFHPNCVVNSGQFSFVIINKILSGFKERGNKISLLNERY